jgi:hypothetical protein
MDVIHAHRMLENAVDVPEYLLVSDDLFHDGGTTASELGMQEVTQDLEWIGRVRTHVLCVEDIPSTLPPLRTPASAG